MRDLQQYAARCCQMLDYLGIRYGKQITFEVNARAKTRLGICKKTGNRYVIEIAAALLDERTNEAELKNTLLHELLHTCRGCMKHTGKWKQLAERVNATYGMQIQRTAAKDAVWLPEELRAQPKYRVMCKNCGTVYERFRMTEFVRHPEKYRCGKCRKQFDLKSSMQLNA